MKKLMIVAAAAAMVASAQAITVNTNCNPKAGVCDDIVFRVTASGKVAAVKESSKYGDYLTASKMKVSRGALVLFNTSTTANDCCYGAYSLYLEVRVNGETYPVGVFGEQLDSWSIFGKGYNKALSAEKSKKFTVESEIGFLYDNANKANNDWTLDGGAPALGLWNTDELEDTHALSPNNGAATLAFAAAAFGKGTYAYNVGKAVNACNVCTPGATTYEFTPKSYSGWFAGLVTNMEGEFGCLLCDCQFVDVFGGTWKAKYDKNMTGRNGWEQAARWVFNGSVVADMKAEDVE